MDFLYRIFYTVLSLGILMILLFPVVGGVRFLLRNIEKKYTIWAWWLFFLRSICPIALSSAVCIVPLWNRKFHQLMSQFGLTIHDNSGILRSWKSVFQNDISVTGTFQVCSIIWIVGVAGVLLFSVLNLQKLKKDMRSAKTLGDAISESEMISVPLRLGFLHGKLYLPAGFQAKEMAFLLPHMEIHAKEMIKRILVLLIMAIHWFNPVMWLYHYWWSSDMEMAADDKMVHGKKESERKSYAQGLINFKREAKKQADGKGIFGGPFFIGVKEENTEKRAQRIMYQKWDKASDRLFALLVLSLVVVFIFLLRPMQIAWSGGTWKSGSGKTEEDILFGEKSVFAVAKMGVKSPEGLEWIVQLEMEAGTESEEGYQGNFVLKVYDKLENEIASRKVANIFPELEAREQYFPKTMTLCISDYNGDGTQELVLGQQVEVAENNDLVATSTAAPKATIEGEVEADLQASESDPGTETQIEYVSYSYVLVNIGNETLDVLCRDIIATGEKANMSESIPFEKIEGIDDIFVIPERENKQYYVWNDRENLYEKREMSEADLEAHKKNAETIENAGEANEHTLEKTDGTVAALVSTKLDSTQSESIQSITISPRGIPKKYEDIQGYYCDLKWLEEKEAERYAQLIYNGTKSQTFVIYDTKTKNVYYRHEDGTDQLRIIFGQYRESDVTFEEGGAVIYELAEKKEDVLTINFAAEADGGITIKGSYSYNVARKEASNLSFTRAVTEEN